MKHSNLHGFVRILAAVITIMDMTLSLAAQQYPQGTRPAAVSQRMKRLPLLSEDERTIFDLLNQERKQNGLAELRWNEQLAVAAQRHAYIMVEHNVLSHSFPDEMPLKDRVAETGVHFSRIAENIGFGGDADNIHNALMHSPGHRANILDPASNEIGISVVINNRRMWVVQDFALTVPELTYDQQVKSVTAKLHSMGVTVRSTDLDAKKACDSSMAPSHVRAMTVVHVETTDLNDLPVEVSRTSEQFHRAAVAACPLRDQRDSMRGFMLYRIAIVFY